MTTLFPETSFQLLTPLQAGFGGQVVQGDFGRILRQRHFVTRGCPVHRTGRGLTCTETSTELMELVRQLEKTGRCQGLTYITWYGPGIIPAGKTDRGKTEPFVGPVGRALTIKKQAINEMEV